MENDTQFKTLYLTDIKADDSDYRISGVFSTDDVDHHNDIIDQDGWDLEIFKSNPVILFGHNSWQPPIGRAENLHFDKSGNLAGDIVFAADEYEFAKTIYNLYKGKFMRAFSVGFRNKEYEVNREDRTVTLTKNLLMEISCVSIPANARALAKQEGIDLNALEVAERKDIEQATSVLKSKGYDVVDLDKKVLMRKHDEEKPQGTDDGEDENGDATPDTTGSEKGITNRDINKWVRNLLASKTK
jgi:HK97 family phage prohead protease